MCLICMLGHSQANEEVEKLVKMYTLATTFPLTTDALRERLRYTIVEMILIIYQCYGVSIRDGMTEDDARRSLLQTFEIDEKGQKELVEKFSELMRKSNGQLTPEIIAEVMQMINNKKRDTYGEVSISIDDLSNPFADMHKKEFH